MQPAKLRKKKVKGHAYWYTAASGGRYFGRVEDVPYEQARRAFAEHLGRARAAAEPAVLGTADLFDRFLAWVKENRSEAQYQRRRRYCSWFAKFRHNGRRLADAPATQVTGAMLEAWREALKPRDPQTILHAEDSVRHAFNWGRKYPSPVPHLPPTFAPFAAVERTHVPPRSLSEANLLTAPEVAALLQGAAVDNDQFRRWGVERTVERVGKDAAKLRPCKDSFADILRVYYDTGARTGELCRARVGDYSPGTGQITLAFHKTSRKTRVKQPRSIKLGKNCGDVVARLCQGRGPDEPIFPARTGKPWTPKQLNERLRSARRVAVALGHRVREGVRIYDFRHLWISEILMAGEGIATVARMAGTSVRMVETVYGHFRVDHLAQAMSRLEELREGRRGQSRSR